MPSVLFINRVYPPDDGATGQLLAELAEALVREGWQVTVLAAGTSKAESGKQTAEIHRVRGLPFTRASLWKRALSYASLYPALLGRALRLPRPDVIVTLTDPPLLLTLGPWLKFWKRARLVHWAQDVYPEVAEELGVVRKKGFAAGVLRWCSTASLRRHDQIIAVGRCMKDRLIARGLDASKIAVIPNWAVGTPAPSSGSPSSDATLSASNRERSDATLAHLMGEGQGVRVPGEVSIPSVQSSEFKVQSSEFKSDHSQPPLTVMYSGNFGLAHPFEAMMEAVKILDQASQREALHPPPVRFVFAGSGPKLEALRGALAPCANVEFRPPAPLENLAEALASADVHLACMSDALLGLVVPSKIYGALAAGRPCLFLGPRDSEAARIILESGRGLVFDPHTGGAELAAVLARWAGRDAEFTACRTACAGSASSASGVPLSDFLRVLRRPTAG